MNDLDESVCTPDTRSTPEHIALRAALSDPDDIPANIKYAENPTISIGGFLVAYGSQIMMVINAGMSNEEKREGRAYLLRCLAENTDQYTGLYLWRLSVTPAPTGQAEIANIGNK